jgi:hypothetical protein
MQIFPFDAQSEKALRDGASGADWSFCLSVDPMSAWCEEALYRYDFYAGSGRGVRSGIEGMGNEDAVWRRGGVFQRDVESKNAF